MLCIGLDVGYNATKLVTDKGATLFLSETGTPEKARFDAGDLLGDRANGSTIELEAPRHVLVGSGAVEQSLYHVRRFDRAWIESALYHDLFLAALTEATSATVSELLIVTGLPVAFVDDDRETLRGLLLGEHRAQRAGRHAQVFKAPAVHIIPQGAGALLSACLDDRGTLVNAELARARVGILDVGGRTTNLLSINRLKDVSRETYSVDVGAWSLVIGLRPWLSANCPELSLRDHEVMDAIRAGGLKYKGDPVDLRPVVADLAGAMADQIAAEATQRWNGGAQLDRILICGGGAHLLGAELTKRIERAHVIDGDPTFSNATGYYRFARRLVRQG